MKHLVFRQVWSDSSRHGLSAVGWEICSVLRGVGLLTTALLSFGSVGLFCKFAAFVPEVAP